MAKAIPAAPDSAIPDANASQNGIPRFMISSVEA